MVHDRLAFIPYYRNCSYTDIVQLILLKVEGPHANIRNFTLFSIVFAALHYLGGLIL